jgi:sec-independent protein translocase protein TatA
MVGAVFIHAPAVAGWRHGVIAGRQPEISSRRIFMGTLSIWHLLILGAIALVLFGGRGKVSDLMGDFGKGINSFKKGLAGDKEEPRVLNAETQAAKDKVSV